ERASSICRVNCFNSASRPMDRADFPVLRSLRRFLMTRPALRTRQDRIRSRYQIPGAEVATLPNYFQTDYQISLRPNWIWRIEVMVLVMAAGPCEMLDWDGKTRFPEASLFGRNAPPVLSAPPGTLNCGELVMLNNSARNCSFNCSIRRKFLKNDTSPLWKPGPVRMPSPELP